MKYIYRIMTLLALSIGFASCADDLTPADGPQKGKLATDDMMPIHIRFEVPGGDAATRSIVPGEREAEEVEKITMVLFDANGYYLGYKDAKFTPDTDTKTKGTIDDAVPASTSRIHFVVNNEAIFNNLASASIGTVENRLMQSEIMTSAYTDANAHISYWGYHKEDNPADMQAWMKGNNNNNTVYLIRDRAKVAIEYVADADGESVEGNKIKSIRWTVVNGLKRGLIAPFNTSDTKNPFNYYDEETNKINTPVTPFNDGGRFLTEVSSQALNDMNNNGTLNVDTQNPDPYSKLKPIYLFEDANDDVDGGNVVKLIVEVTYKYESQLDDGTSTNKKYHAVLLMNNNYELYKVTRNHIYRLTIKGLPFALGYAKFEDALTGTDYSNGQLMQVEEEATDVTDGEYSLSILPGTSVVFQQPAVGGTVQIPFQFYRGSKSNNVPATYESEGESKTYTANDFFVEWQGNQNVATATPTVAYGNDGYDGTINVPLDAITTSLKYGKLVLRDKHRGLQRYVNVYSILKYQIREAVFELVSGTHGSSNNPVYHLKLAMPNTSTTAYPEGLYPITIRFATSTLSAFSDKVSREDNFPAFGVDDMTPTNNLAEGGVNAWNYKAKSWGYWYQYQILTKKDYEELNATNKTSDEIHLYFEDVRSKRENKNIANVGMYLEIEYFGGLKTIYTDASTGTGVIDNL